MINNALLFEIVEANKLTDNDFAPFTTFNHPKKESYGRRLIFDNGNFKILLMSWTPGDFTAIHNHGIAEFGCVYFFGEATHRLYSFNNDELKIIKKDIFHKSQIVPVRGDLTHLMGNAGSGDFATLHIYGSNRHPDNITTNAKVYVPEEKKVFTTTGSAYLKMDKKLILSETPFTNFNSEAMFDYFSLVAPFYKRNNMVDVLSEIDKFLDCHHN